MARRKNSDMDNEDYARRKRSAEEGAILIAKAEEECIEEADNRTPEERELDEIIPVFKENKDEMDAYKKLVDKANGAIKAIMLAIGKDSYITNGIEAKVSVSKRETFIEEMLIAKLKKLKLQKGIVKKREYVDMDALESAIYNGLINAAELKECQEVKEVVTLKVANVKTKKSK